MTEQELNTVREALINQHPPRRSFDDLLQYGVWAVGVTSTVYFGAHIVAYLVTG